MATDILGTLMGSPSRVKAIRLFLLNPKIVFSTDDIREKARMTPLHAKKELQNLFKIGLIKRKADKKTFFVARGKKQIKKYKKISGWALDGGFHYLEPLTKLILNNTPLEHQKIAQRFKNAGRIKLIIVSGVFVQNDESLLDMLIVGDFLRRALITRSLRRLEAEVGRELRYGVLETGDFLYRYDVYDRFVRDILDYPHEKIVDKIGLPAVR